VIHVQGGASDQAELHAAVEQARAVEGQVVDDMVDRWTTHDVIRAYATMAMGAHATGNQTTVRQTSGIVASVSNRRKV
jgi:hypothetical protein